MSAWNLLTVRSLRAYLLAVSVLVGTYSQSFAGTVKLDYTGQTGATTVNVAWTGGGTSTNAGRFNWTVLAGGTHTTAPFTVGTNFGTFCINVRYGLIDPNFYNLTNAIDQLPTPGSVMGLANANKLRILVNEIFGNGSLNSLNSAWADVQVAVWKIVNSADGAFNITGGSVNYSNVTSIINAVNAILPNYATYASTMSMFTYGLDDVSQTGGQDQIYWNSQPDLIVEVPVPAGVVLAGMGIAVVGGVNFLRRRKVVAAI